MFSTLDSHYKRRSIARELIENENKYLATLEKSGYTKQVIHQIRKTNTSILLEEVKTASINQALAKQSGAQLEKNSMGIEMLYAYAPLEIPDVNWIIISSMTEEEVSKRINNLRHLN